MWVSLNFLFLFIFFGRYSCFFLYGRNARGTSTEIFGSNEQGRQKHKCNSLGRWSWQVNKSRYHRHKSFHGSGFSRHPSTAQKAGTESPKWGEFCWNAAGQRRSENNVAGLGRAGPCGTVNGPIYATKKLIPGQVTWVQCFSIYAAVLLSQHPEGILDLLGYAAFTAKWSQKFKWPFR